jgi:hypothetical protein
MRLVVIPAIAAFAFPFGAGAEGCQGARDAVSVVQHIFDQADRDQDGSLTQSEYEQAGLQHYGVTFEQSDLDGDGGTSVDEYLLLYESHHPAGGETEV